jgi:hypothetical protein
MVVESLPGVCLHVTFAAMADDGAGYGGSPSERPYGLKAREVR